MHFSGLHGHASYYTTSEYGITNCKSSKSDYGSLIHFCLCGKFSGVQSPRFLCITLPYPLIHSAVS